jgi:sugar lactone lactonase YvrE
VLSFDASGVRRVELEVASFPFSVDWLPDGRTVLTTSTGVVLDDGSPYGASGQAWNEIVVEPRGNVFSSAAGFDMMGGETPKPGFVWVVCPDMTSRRVAEELMFPNGMVVTPTATH